MKTILFLIFISICTFQLLIAQEKKKTETATSKVNSTQSAGDKIEFKNGGNAIITITDEGNNTGSITLPEMSSSPGETLNKLYNENGTLMFDGFEIGSGGASAIDDLTDGKSDGFSLFIGDGAGFNDDGGNSDEQENYNTGVGKLSLPFNTTGEYNSGYGYRSLFNNSIGEKNTGIGVNALYNNTTGSSNIGLGYDANFNNKTGSDNTMIGFRAGRGQSNNDVEENVYIGSLAGFNATGSKNIFIGKDAGFSETGSSLLYIENSNSPDPLIWGDFLNDDVKINGDLEITSKTVTSSFQIPTGASNGYILTSDANGNASWQAGGSGGSGPDDDWSISNDDMHSVPTGNLGIGTSSPNTKLHVSGNDGVLFQGSHGSGSVSNFGAGTRLHWYSKKSAF